MESFLGHGRRRVQLPLGLLDDHDDLAAELVGIQQGIPQGVGLDIDCLRQAAHRQDGVVGRVVVGGPGVEVAAGVLGLAGDLADTPGGGALEEHVFQHVRNPRPVVRLIEKSGAHPGYDGYRGKIRDVLHHQGQPVRQDPAADTGRPERKRHGGER
jgi:hypothetical protein